MASVKSINKGLQTKYGDLQIVRGNGYWFFDGAYHMEETGLYGGWNLRNCSVSDIIEEVELRIRKRNNGT